MCFLNLESILSTCYATNQCSHLNIQDLKKIGSYMGGGSKILWWRIASACLIRAAGRFEGTYDELDSTHNNMMT